ncbi:MAG: ImmA/IrrE family metallo-endopeptidase [Oscillospiraceae bacterium]|nr:ImmA/IrrE family metallo-endopeptidase [Oscillospiraceae bacterium]
MMKFLHDICRNESIALNCISKEKLREMKSRGGFALGKGEDKRIFVDENIWGWEACHIIAHEVGHVLMGHLDSSEVSDDRKEQEARYFAGALMALMVFHQYYNN